ncbi:hypothetical protein [Microtetraspora malaysiensis]|uniref:hypothetical protein n=1 Tax=Microtetraspora malaysiensis TaxID=161358 RepID=UPI000A9BC2A8|nr:hypothetical protein [Microtetraspora malaysiensis]
MQPSELIPLIVSALNLATALVGWAASRQRRRPQSLTDSDLRPRTPTEAEDPPTGS